MVRPVPTSPLGAPTTIFRCTSSTGDRSTRRLGWPAMLCTCLDLTLMWRSPTFLPRRALSTAIAPSAGSGLACRPFADLAHPELLSSQLLPLTAGTRLLVERCGPRAALLRSFGGAVDVSERGPARPPGSRARSCA